MSSNVGLSTPRGSGTSGYVQRNTAFMKSRSAPYPPVSGANGADGRPFKQRQPDKQILEHDRRRAVEVKVMEERERLEEENERIEEEQRGKGKKTTAAAAAAKKTTEEGEADEEQEQGERVLSEEEIEERCAALRERLLKEMEEEKDEGRGGPARGGRPPAPKERRQFKAYQVHELAEAKIEESERLRRALGIREDRETGEISGRERRERARRED